MKRSSFFILFFLCIGSLLANEELEARFKSIDTENQNFVKNNLIEVKENLIRARNYLMDDKYPVHKSLTSLIAFIDEGAFAGRPYLLYSKIDNIIFYLKSNKSIPFIVENSTVPFLEAARNKASEFVVRNEVGLKDKMELVEGHQSEVAKKHQKEVTVLNERIQQLEKTKTNNKEKGTNPYLFISLFGLILLPLAYKVGARKKKVTKIVNKYKVDEDFINSFKHEAFITLDKKGNVKSLNKTAENWLEGSIAVGDNWSEYSTKFFFRDKSLSNLKNFYRNRLFSKFIYKIDHETHLRSKTEIVTIGRLNYLDLLTVNKSQVNEEFIQDTVLTIDSAIDDLIATKGYESLIHIFDLVTVSSKAKSIYLNSFEAKQFFKNFLSLVHVIGNANHALKFEGLRVHRNDNGNIEFIALWNNSFITEGHLEANGRAVVYTQEKLKREQSEILESLTIKNISLEGEKQVQLQCSISDLESYSANIEKYNHSRVNGRVYA